MAQIDDNFIRMCSDILEHGTTTEGQRVRPHWPDGTPAYTIKTFGVVTRYDLSKEFPVLTLRKTPVKSALDELLWIWQQKSNNIHDLHSGVWDEWADEQGTIGEAYGYQMAVKHLYRDVTEEGLEHAFPGKKAGELRQVTAEQNPGLSQAEDNAARAIGDGMKPFCSDGKKPFCSDGKTDPGEAPRELRPEQAEELTGLDSAAFRKTPAIHDPVHGTWYMDQVDRVIYDLKNNPFSRRIMTSIYTFSDLHAMNLYPCAYSMTFNVTQKPGHEKLTLNGIMNQRSQDILTAFAWNEWQYACLLALMAQVCDMEAGEFVHVVADAHIYDRHVDAVKELISRTPQPAPKVRINPDVHDFYEFTRDDVKLMDYKVAGDQIRNIPVAI